MVQVGYKEQWGPTGRNDLAVMSKIGANAVRLYHSLGLESDEDHGAFLDHALSVGLDVMPGFHSDQAMEADVCPGFDCYEAWKSAALKGFQTGFKQGDEWHPAISSLILLNEPDFLEYAPQCQPKGAWCRVKAALSALDGVLAAEKEAGVAAGRVRLAVTWSFAMRTSIDGKLNGPGTFGFQDIAAGIADPMIANYTPRMGQDALATAYTERWMHGLNTQSPWNFVNEMVSKVYDQFSPIPWFIGEYGANGQPRQTIQQDLEAMEAQANQNKGRDFVGTAFFQFQVANEKGGSELNFGIFSLGDAVLGQTGQVCDKFAPCATWPVHCLSTELSWLPGTLADRAPALAAAWQGSLDDLPGLCGAATSSGSPSTTTPSAPAASTTTGAPSTTAAASTSEAAGEATSTATTTAAATEATTTSGEAQPDGSELPPMKPLRGVAYGALPCTEHDCGGQGRPSEDMLQEGYSKQWGEDGRDDLGTMAALGANAVRLYHSLGIEPRDSHVGFLDRAQAVGLNVMAGYHTEAANDPEECPGYDCFDTWKKATLRGFELGFKKAGAWHPAVATLILLNEPDFFEHQPKCQPSGAWCRVKAAVSALDGVLAAEKEAGVEAGRVNFTVAWSFAMATSIDGKVTGPGTFGFQDMVAVIVDPSIAHYEPRASQAELQEAFSTRWVHSLNTQAPWSFVNEMVTKEYHHFAPAPWFIGEYGGNGQDKAVIQADLEAMNTHAAESSDFLGAAFFQFQTTYWKGGAEMNFGMFGLGDELLGKTGELCDKMSPCQRWPVHCLTADLSWLPGTKALRAEAAAAAWGGRVPLDSNGFCGSARRLAGEAAPEVSTRISLQIRRSAVDSEAAVEEALGSPAFAGELTERVGQELGPHSDAVLGALSVFGAAARPADSTTAEATTTRGGGHQDVQGGEADSGDGSGESGETTMPNFPWWGWLSIGGGVGFLAVGCVAAAVLSCLSRKQGRAAAAARAEERRRAQAASRAHGDQVANVV